MALQKTHNDPVVQTLLNDAFYGDLELGDFQEVYRIPAAVAPETMARQLELGMREINASLAVWKKEQTDAGTIALGDLDAASEPPGAATKFYTEAVFARAYGLMIPMLITLYFTDQADGLEGELGENEARFYERSNNLLGRLQGLGGNQVASLL